MSDRQRPQKSVLVPVLNDDLTTQTFIVPVEFANRLELHAFKMIEALKDESSFQPENQLMQAMSYIMQTAVGTYLDEQSNDDLDPPEIAK